MSQKMADKISKAIEQLYSQTIPQACGELTSRKIEITGIVIETSGKQVKIVINGDTKPIEYKELVKVLYRTVGILFPLPAGDYTGVDGKEYRRTHIAYDETQGKWAVRFNLFLPGDVKPF